MDVKCPLFFTLHMETRVDEVFTLIMMMAHVLIIKKKIMYSFSSVTNYS